MDFKGTKQITLRSGAADNKYNFIIAAAETETGIGSIPYGTTIASAAVETVDTNGVVVESFCTIITTAANKITVGLDYPSTGAGLYSIIFTLTLNTGDIWIKNFDRIRAL